MSVNNDLSEKSNDRQSQALISFIQEITFLRTRNELFNALQSWLSKILGSLRVEIYIHNAVDKNYADFNNVGQSVSASTFEFINDSEEPLLFFSGQTPFKNNSPEIIMNRFKHGFNGILSIGLSNGKRHIGIMLIMTERDEIFNNNQIRLIKRLTRQLGVVISNLIAQELFLEKENDYSFLLSFSKEISAVRNREHLAVVIERQIKKLIPVQQLVLIVHDGKRQQYLDFLNSAPPNWLMSNVGSSNIIRDSLGEELFKLLSETNNPVAIDMDKVSKVNFAGTVSKDRKELIGIAISRDSLLLGGLYLLGYSSPGLFKRYHNILLAIADQLSALIVNIQTLEQIGEKENQKNILLSMSNDLAKVKSKSDLHKFINAKLENIIPYTYCLTLQLSDDEKDGIIFLENQSLTDAAFPLTLGTKHLINVNDRFHQTALIAGGPVLFDLNSHSQELDVPAYIRPITFSGIREVVIAPLTDGKSNIGLIIILTENNNHIHQVDLELVQGLSSQLAIAMSNILANEKIDQQVLEISQYRHRLEIENSYLKKEVLTTHNYSEIISSSRLMNGIFELIAQVAETQSTVLLLGETGTGKELIARAIHNSSLRKGKALIKVNCATLPANLIESELFGHERGSFTGATERRIGKFELAQNSTILLDEIGELPLDLQVKLLRTLQEQEIERVGGRSVIKINVRIIAATNRDLSKEVEAGNFRSDLFYRLNIFPITVPPLRDRKDDIPVLATHFLEKYNKKSTKRITGFSNDALRQLLNYNWPGNVRELEHVIERNILLTSGNIIKQFNLTTGLSETQAENSTAGSIFKTIDEIERAHIMAVLKSCNGKVAGTGGAAEILRLPATTIHSKMRRLGINKKYSSR